MVGRLALFTLVVAAGFGGCTSGPEAERRGVKTTPVGAPSGEPEWHAELSGKRDLDGDGVVEPFDCDDRDAAVHPGALETLEDGVDQDCDGGDDTTWMLGGEVSWILPGRPRVVRTQQHPILLVGSDGFTGPDFGLLVDALVLRPLQTHGAMAPPAPIAVLAEGDARVETVVDVAVGPTGLSVGWAVRVDPSLPLFTGWVNTYRAKPVFGAATGTWEATDLLWETAVLERPEVAAMSLDTARSEAGEDWTVSCRARTVQVRAPVDMTGATWTREFDNLDGHPAGLCFWGERPSGASPRLVNCVDPTTPCEVIEVDPDGLFDQLVVVDEPPWTGALVSQAQRRGDWLGVVKPGTLGLQLLGPDGAEVTVWPDDEVLDFDFSESRGASPRVAVVALLAGAVPEVRVWMGDQFEQLDQELEVPYPSDWGPMGVTVDLDDSGLTVALSATGVPPDGDHVGWASLAF